MNSRSGIFIVLTAIGLILSSVAKEKISDRNVPRKTTFEHEGKQVTFTPNAYRNNQSSSALIGVSGIILIVMGCSTQATARGRSPLWGLCGILGPLGILFIAVLKDKEKEPNQSIESIVTTSVN
jgi:hypothetical protein